MQFQDSEHPDGVSSDHDSTKGGNTTLAQARQRKADAAVSLRLAGASWSDIARTVGYPTPRQAIVSTEKALAKRLDNPQDREKMRQLAGARLERLLMSVWPKATDPAHPEHLYALGKAREIIDRHAKLFGLDAPTEIVVHTPTQTELEAWVSQMLAGTLPPVHEYDIITGQIVEDDGAVSTG